MALVHDSESLLETYFAWLKDNTRVREMNGQWIEITTPHLDRHNDALQIYVQKRGDRYVLTDDGYVLRDLVQSGCKLDSPKRQSLLKMTLAGFGVADRENRLEVESGITDFPIKKHNLVQAMLAVNDLFFMAVPMVLNLFFEDAVGWLDANGIRYISNVKFTGRSGFDHLFDFAIPKSKTSPERYIETVTHPTRASAEGMVLKWLDTKDSRPENSRAFALINDQDNRVAQTIIEALRQYEVTPIRWTERGDALRELAA